MKKKYLLTVLSLSAMATSLLLLESRQFTVNAANTWINDVTSMNDERAASVISSTIEGAHIRINSDGSKEQFVPVTFDHDTAKRDWSAGDGFVVEFENQSWGWSNINFELVTDPGWNSFCADGWFTSPDSEPNV